MQKKAEQTQLNLKKWIFNKDGKQINKLIEIGFLEFYFTKKALEDH